MLYCVCIFNESLNAFNISSRSVCLLIQVALPCLVLAPEKSMLLLKGGTNADMAPPIDFFTEVKSIQFFSIFVARQFSRRLFSDFRNIIFSTSVRKTADFGTHFGGF